MALLIQGEGEFSEWHLLESHPDPPEAGKKSGVSLSFPSPLLQQRPAASDGRAGTIFGHRQVAVTLALCAQPAITGVPLHPVGEDNHSNSGETKGDSFHRASCTHLATGGEGLPHLRKGCADCGTLLGTQHNHESSRAVAGGYFECLRTTDLTREKKTHIFH